MRRVVYILIPMPNINVYLPDDLAKRVETVKDQLNVSAICQRALREELVIMQAVDTQENMERLEVDVEGRDGYGRTLAFTGRWLVWPDPDMTRTGQKGYDLGNYWGVALTKRGRIAVYAAHCNRGQGGLTDYDDLDEALADGVPADIIADARGELNGEVPVLELDI